MNATTIAFSPLLPWPAWYALAVVVVLVTAAALLRRGRGAPLRALAMLALLGLLAGPSLVQERRAPVKDIAAIVVDRSPSQGFGERQARTDKALAELRERLAQVPDLDVRVVTAGGAEGAAETETKLFAPLDQVLADVPRDRLAGTILLTDGQVHDAPAGDGANEAAQLAERYGPVHGLLSGTRDERDRRLQIVRAPTYGIVGKNVAVTVKVEDSADIGQRSARVTLTRDGGSADTITLPVGVERTIELPVAHGGQNLIELEAEFVDGELTRANNRAAIAVTGVRERLRVLLISGEPHNGERTWRNLLKADPSVDLVHFTILRPLDKQDGTPIRELSLIAFPIKELFEVKLTEFDLVIFDRYEQRGILPPAYYENLSQYVLKGGAILEASGPGFNSPMSLYRTALRQVIPGAPVAGVARGEAAAPFRPSLTDLGRRHPVTAGLPGDAGPGKEAGWGRWLRQNDLSVQRGSVVMSGAAGKPLLILDRIGEGRVAQLASDQIWLWSRGYEGGGPQAELLRRLAHWLMKEPELEEDELRARVEGNRITVERQSLEPVNLPVQVTTPSGATETLALQQAPGAAVASAGIVAKELGVYRIVQGDKTAFAVVGSLNPQELSDARTTEDKLQPAVQATGGSLHWLAEGGTPQVRRIEAGRTAAGSDWIGLRRNGRYAVVGTTEIPLLPTAVTLAAMALLLAGAWWRESRR